MPLARVEPVSAVSLSLLLSGSSLLENIIILIILPASSLSP